MSSRRQRSIPLVGRYRQVSLYKKWLTHSTCVYNNAPTKDVSALGKREWTRSYRNPLYSVYIPTTIVYSGVSGFVTGCPCGAWGRGLTSCPLHAGSFLANLIKISRCQYSMELGIVLLSYKIYIDSTCWYILPQVSQFVVFLFSPLKCF